MGIVPVHLILLAPFIYLTPSPPRVLGTDHVLVSQVNTIKMSVYKYHMAEF